MVNLNWRYIEKFKITRFNYILKYIIYKIYKKEGTIPPLGSLITRYRWAWSLSLRDHTIARTRWRSPQQVHWPTGIQMSNIWRRLYAPVYRTGYGSRHLGVGGCCLRSPWHWRDYHSVDLSQRSSWLGHLCYGVQRLWRGSWSRLGSLWERRRGGRANRYYYFS